MTQLPSLRYSGMYSHPYLTGAPHWFLWTALFGMLLHLGNQAFDLSGESLTLIQVLMAG